MQSSERELAQSQLQLKQKVNCHVTVTRKEAELTRAEETIRRNQQQIWELRQRVSIVCEDIMCGVCCD